MSLAALWKLPVIFVCENNEYAMGTPLSRHLSLLDVSKKADAYGMPRDRFIADDVFTVRDRLKIAVDRARAGDGPSLIEIRTYRYRGHSMSDPAKYRSKEEVDDHKKRDALGRLRKQLQDFDGTEDKVAEIDAAIEAEVTASLKYAEESPDPTPDILEEVTYTGEFAR